MDFLTAIIYGVLQGITEFLPISSSAHLAIIPHFLKIPDPGMNFDLMMHLGTVFALLVYFRQKIWDLGKVPLKMIFGLKETPSIHQKNVILLRHFLISTFFSILFILLLRKAAASLDRNYYLISFNLIVFGFLLYFIDKIKGKRDSEASDHQMESSFSLKNAAFIGISQAIAIFPGISRSGITITVGRLCNLSRNEASQYTFFLSIPIILLGAGVHLAETLTVVLFHQIDGISQAGAITSYSALGVGLLTSFFVGLLTIHNFLKLVNKISFLFFFLYRVALAIIILASML